MGEAVSRGPGPGSGSGSGSGTRVANLLLIVLALALAVTVGLFATREATATPRDARAETLSRAHAQVADAARRETLAFLTVDYRDMDPLIAAVLAGATGPFKKQYARQGSELKASARRARASSTGRVLSVGVGRISDRTAVVYVAADSQVTNASTKGATQPRYYRLRLTLVRQGQRWLTSNLKFVG